MSFSQRLAHADLDEASVAVNGVQSPINRTPADQRNTGLFGHGRVILSPRGGALATMLTPTRLGLGAVLGDGRGFMSWVSLDDAVSADEICAAEERSVLTGSAESV